MRISLEQVTGEPESKSKVEESPEKLTSSKLAQKLGMKTNEFTEKLISSGHLEVRNGKHYLTTKGKEVGGEFHMSPKFGPYFLWFESFQP